MFKYLIFSAIIFINSVSFNTAKAEDKLLQEAIQNNDSELVEILMKYGSDPVMPVLIKAMQERDYFAVKMLVEYGADINSRGGKLPYSNYSQTVLEMAVESGELSLIEFFLWHRADPTNVRERKDRYGTYFTTAIYDTINRNRLDVLILFAQHNIDYNKICYKVVSSQYQQNGYEQTPLQSAIALNRREFVAFLLSQGVKI